MKTGGPIVGQIIDRLEELYLENPNFTKDQLIKMVKKMYDKIKND